MTKLKEMKDYIINNKSVINPNVANSIIDSIVDDWVATYANYISYKNLPRVNFDDISWNQNGYVPFGHKVSLSTDVEDGIIMVQIQKYVDGHTTDSNQFVKYSQPFEIFTNKKGDSISVGSKVEKPPMPTERFGMSFYNSLPLLAAPECTPVRDYDHLVYTSLVKIESLWNIKNTKIYYTLDGTEPTENSLLYENPLQLTGMQTFKGFQKHEDYFDSDVTTINFAPFVVEDVSSTPPPWSTINAETLITLSCATEGASIYYTTDGSTPTAQSTLYTAPMTIPGKQLFAVAVKAGGFDSSINYFSFS